MESLQEVAIKRETNLPNCLYLYSRVLGSCLESMSNIIRIMSNVEMHVEMHVEMKVHVENLDSRRMKSDSNITGSSRG